MRRYATQDHSSGRHRVQGQRLVCNRLAVLFVLDERAKFNIILIRARLIVQAGLRRESFERQRLWRNQRKRLLEGLELVQRVKQLQRIEPLKVERELRKALD